MGLTSVGVTAAENSPIKPLVSFLYQGTPLSYSVNNKVLQPAVQMVAMQIGQKNNNVSMRVN